MNPLINLSRYNTIQYTAEVVKVIECVDRYTDIFVIDRDAVILILTLADIESRLSYINASIILVQLRRGLTRTAMYRMLIVECPRPIMERFAASRSQKVARS